MKSVLVRVIALLESRPDLRDDVDNTLKAIWEQDLSEINMSLHTITGDQLLELAAQRKITHFETVRRMWQIAQKENPHLRGKEYDIRRGKKQEQVKEEIKEISRTAAVEEKSSVEPSIPQGKLFA